MYLINSDVRMFYFTNIVFALSSFCIFYLILRKLVGNPLIKAFVLILYVTNYDLYWFPNLAMAENLTLLLSLTGILLLLAKVNLFNIIAAGILVVSFYATKYASVPLVISFFIAYFIKLFLLWRGKQFKFEKFIVFLSSTLITFIIFCFYEYLSKGSFPLSSLVSFGTSLSNKSTAQVTSSTTFSLAYVDINIRHYLNALTGGSERFLWDSTPIVPKFVAIGGLLGLVIGLIKVNLRFICFSFLLIILSSILFMSTFYTTDMRYIYQVIPILLLGFAILLTLALDYSNKKLFRYCVIFIVSTLFLYYGLTNVIRIKSQISLNLRYTETPWYYVNVLELNKFFATPTQSLTGKKPVVISPMAPYYVDFFSNGNYTLLPLSVQQEFRSYKENAWGLNDYSDLIKLYKKYLQEGYILYLANYGLGNEGYLHSDFDAIKKIFKVTEVSVGCYNACNIYRVELQ
ncbi:MAG: hypothetical protein PHQ59_02845 [Candidatus Daviesbacteria bacterium]|nr:hypothetical protein [Candidatus Daviesbacteria bacterium]